MKRGGSSSSSARVATTISVIVAALVLAGVASAGPPREAQRPAYSIPLEYGPEPGTLDRAKRRRVVVAPEFSFSVSGAALAKAIPGFESDLFGMAQSTSVIVRNFSAQENEAWEPSSAAIEAWDNIWHRRGHLASACVADELDDVSGLVRYHTLCDPAPSLDSTIYLMDRRPDSAAPRPESQDYIRATCRIDTAVRAPTAGRFHQCAFRRMTPWGVQIQFRLNGENVALMDAVESYLVSLLGSWRVPAEARAGRVPGPRPVPD